MRKVTKIDAAVGVNFLQSKLRVAAYCRVSTDGEDQLSSLENQTTHYTNYIKSNPEWEFAGLYFEMKIAKLIQFENMNPVRKARNKGF